MMEAIEVMGALWFFGGIGLCAFLWCLGLGIKHYMEKTCGWYEGWWL